MENETAIDRILDELATQGLSEAEFCRRMGELQQTFSAWKKRGFPAAKAVKASDVLCVTVEWILAGREPRHKVTAEQITVPAGWSANYRRIPVISYIQAGIAREVVDDHAMGEGFETIGIDQDLAQQLGQHTFALVVSGDSMEPEFREGDLVVIDPDAPVRPGDFVVAKLEHDQAATLKRYRDRGLDANRKPRFELVPLNDFYPIIMVDEENPGKIIGPVVEYRRKLR